MLNTNPIVLNFPAQKSSIWILHESESNFQQFSELCKKKLIWKIQICNYFYTAKIIPDTNYLYQRIFLILKKILHSWNGFFLAKTKPQGAFGGIFLCSFLGGAIFHFLSSSGYMGQYALKQMTLLSGGAIVTCSRSWSSELLQ